MWADPQATDMAFAVELAVVFRLERLAQILNRSRIVARVDEVFRTAGLSIASHDPSNGRSKARSGKRHSSTFRFTPKPKAPPRIAKVWKDEVPTPSS